ncbi:MAG: peroxide stress protein YaaA [Marmoricola sp.]
MLILLPPSEGKSAPRRGGVLDLEALSFPALAAARATVLEELVSLCSADPARAAAVLGLGPTQAEQVATNARLRTAPTTRADRLYSGVLYDALDLAGLEPAARRRATRWLAVTSALFGLLRPQDRVPAYRLSGSVSLPGLGPVAGHWRAHLDPAVAEALGAGLLVDLRSSTYAGFWRPDAGVAARTATVRVLQEQDGRRSVVSHFNKATKGRLVRALLEDGGTPRNPAELTAQLGDLGFTVEPGRPGRTGTPLDVIVQSL